MSTSVTGAEAIARAGSSIAEAQRIVAFTGAGISTASGIPDYRGPHGLWKTETPVYYQDFMASEAARIRYWDQKLRGESAMADAKPTAVHRSLVDLEQAGMLEAVVTQNVDGLHAVAGTAPERLVELHGTVREVECQSCGERSDPAPHYAAFIDTGAAPRCHCGGYLKPATISFGQALRSDDLSRAFAAAERADLVIAIGSTLSVTPAASIPLHAAESGAPYLIVNRGPTDHDGLPHVTLRIEGDAEQIVPAAIAAALAQRKGPLQ